MLQRDYFKEPLKRGEIINEKDIRYLYLEENLTKEQCARRINVSTRKIDEAVSLYNIKKTKEQIKLSREKTCLEKYGVTNCFKDKERVRRGVQNKYGVDNIANLEEIKNKKKETCLKKYGVEHISKLDYYKKRIVKKANKTKAEKRKKKKSQTFIPVINRLELLQEYNYKKKPLIELSSIFHLSIYEIKKHIKYYGISEPRFINKNELKRKYFSKEEITKRAVQKRKRTNLERYGYENNAQDPNCRKKIEQTCLKRYGTKSPLQNKELLEKVKQHNIEKYGVDFPLRLKEIRDKSRQTWLDKYGVDNPTKCEDVKEKIKNTCKNIYGVDNPSKCEEIKEKIKQKVREKTGYDYNFQRPEVIEKSHSREIMFKKYNTLGRNRKKRTKPELYIEQKLLQKFHTVKIEHYDKIRYPFPCDFYIPEIDLFIEYQGFVSHGGHIFSKDNPQDIQQINYWKTKSEEINCLGNKKTDYLDYIDVWTRRDPLKRQTAKNNKLYWLEFFTLKEFDEWFDKI